MVPGDADESCTFAVFGFASTHDALSAEAILADMGVDAVPIAPPVATGAPCGIALQLDAAEARRARGYLEAAGITTSVTYLD
ncbi:MAG: DUF3343 domain-containing protein [Coriobacteriia bacterium]|nr:DUF3343 domain-containing protein [Coriobacteriia bacterium]